jgi:hypothetical protein
MAKTSHRLSHPPFDKVCDIHKGIAKTFSRLSVQASLIGRPPPQELYSQINTITTAHLRNGPFSDMHEARDDLNTILLQSLRPPDSSLPSDVVFMSNVDNQTNRYRHVALLNQWNLRLGMFMTDKLGDPSGDDMRRIRLLRVQNMIATIWNSTTLSDSESAFDSYTPQFRTLISLANKIIINSTTPQTASNSSRGSTPNLTPNSTPSTEQSSTAYISKPQLSFAFETGIVFALYFTALKCRSPEIRRQAVSLLAHANPQCEGMWDARILGKICQRVIEVEESGCVFTVTEDPLTWPMEEQRIHSAFTLPNQEPALSSYQILFTWRPDGPGGAWMDWTETITR